MRSQLPILVWIKDTKVPAAAAVLISLLMLGEHVLPCFLSEQVEDAVELSENQEEESKSSKEKEMEIEDSDQFLHVFDNYRFLSSEILMDRFGQIDVRIMTVSSVDTPPPEFV